jgi:hypothetical protein
LHQADVSVDEGAAVDSELWKALGAYGWPLGKAVTWDALINGIERYDLPGSRTWQRSLAAVCWAAAQNADWSAASEELQQHGLARLGAAYFPAKASAPAVSHIAGLAPAVAGDPVIMARCRRTATDHRVVVVGQLPSPNLHAVVFVRAGDRSGIWFSQEEPLRVQDGGTAFCAYIYLGNPAGIAHQSAGQLRKPLRYDVQIFALRNRWSHGRLSLTAQQRRRLLDPCEVVCKWPVDRESHQITRERQAIRNLVLSHAGAEAVPINLPVRFDCIAPVTLTWAERGRVDFEIRLAENDKSVFRDPVRVDGDGVVLTMATGKRFRNAQHQVIELPKPSLYRIKLREEKRVFLDPFFEIWLEITAPGRSKRGGSKTPSAEATQEELKRLRREVAQLKQSQRRKPRA